MTKIIWIHGKLFKPVRKNVYTFFKFEVLFDFG